MTYARWRQHPGFFAHLCAKNGGVVLALQGDVDRIVARSTLRSFLVQALTYCDAPEVTVDLTEVGFIDSAGIDELRFACSQALDSGKSLLLQASSPVAGLLVLRFARSEHLYLVENDARGPVDDGARNP